VGPKQISWCKWGLTCLQPTFFLAIRVGCFHLAVNERLTLSLHYFQTWWHGVTHCRQMVPNGINAFRSFRHLLPKSTAFSSWCGRGQGEGNVPVPFRLKKHHTEKHVICKTIYVGVCVASHVYWYLHQCVVRVFVPVFRYVCVYINVRMYRYAKN
jgi:hypothetical protein